MTNRSLLFRRFAVTLLLGALTLTGGCQTVRNLGTGQRMDSSTKRPRHEPSTKTREMQVEITTDPAGVAANVRFVRGSGSEAVDNYVVESVKSSWRGQPGTIALVELTFSQAEGFSEPKVISTRPVPQ